MSYDLMVFEQTVALKKNDEFMEWYFRGDIFKGSHDSNDPRISSESLQNFFHDLIKIYPPMNGPFRSDDVDDPKVSDYTIGKSAIYIAFAWSEAEEAYQTVRRLADKHKVGFFDVSGDSEIVFPSA